MKQIRKAICLLLMAACLVGYLLPARAQALEYSGNLWNVVIVLDNSGSLQRMKDKSQNTDPKGYRYEAVAALLNVLHDGTNVGASLFSAIDGEAPIQVPMRELTGENRQGVIRDIEVQTFGIKSTDIIGGLNTGVDMLDKACAENGRPGAIFLFSDGISNPKMVDSEMNAVAERIRKGGYELCGCYLNKNDDGSARGSDVRKIVEAVLEYPVSTDSDYYHEILKPEVLHQCTQAFMRILGYGIQDINPDPEYDSFSKEITIPGVGINEFSYIIYTENGQSLPKGLKVELQNPMGDIIKPEKGGQMELLTHNNPVAGAVSDTQRVYKVKSPEGGTWRVNVTLPPKNDIGVIFNPVYSLEVSVMLESTPAAEDLHANMGVDLEAFLAQNGKKFVDASAYSGYDCSFILKNRDTNDTQEIKLTKGADGRFKVNDFQLDYGIYYPRVKFSCGQLAVISPENIIWDLQNEAPTATDTTLSFKTGLFQENEQTKELKDFINDREDGTNLTLTLMNQVKGVTLSPDGAFTVDGSKSGDCTVDILVTDSQGATAEMRVIVETTNVTVPILIGIGIAILLLIILVIVIIVLRNSGVPNKDFTATFTLENVDDGTGRQKDIVFSEIPLTGPGTGSIKRSTNLYQILCCDIEKKEYGGIGEECRNNETLFNNVKAIIEGMASELSKVRVGIGRAKGSPAIAVRYHKDSQILSNAPGYEPVMTLALSVTSFELKYTDPRFVSPDSDFGCGDDDFGFPSGGSSSEPVVSPDSGSDAYSGYSSEGGSDF